jgi:hypothetical protein
MECAAFVHDRCLIARAGLESQFYRWGEIDFLRRVERLSTVLRRDESRNQLAVTQEIDTAYDIVVYDAERHASYGRAFSENLFGLDLIAYYTSHERAASVATLITQDAEWRWLRLDEANRHLAVGIEWEVDVLRVRLDPLVIKPQFGVLIGASYPGWRYLACVLVQGNVVAPYWPLGYGAASSLRTSGGRLQVLAEEQSIPFHRGHPGEPPHIISKHQNLWPLEVSCAIGRLGYSPASVHVAFGLPMPWDNLSGEGLAVKILITK